MRTWMSKPRQRAAIKAVAAPGSDELEVAVGYTAITSVLVATNQDKVVAILIAQKRSKAALIAALRRQWPKATLKRLPTSRYLEKVIEFIEAPKANLGLPIEIRGTPFQRRVWQTVMRIPFGQTATFASIASEVGSPGAVRAVGNACSRNPLEFAIPCHRVLRSDGSYSGGSDWGNARQATIVEREAAARARKRPR
jgi:AraC family transcriptional regulator of adaptative response/methylated-DNA-[protein]-cysteine methyltransferase